MYKHHWSPEEISKRAGPSSTERRKFFCWTCSKRVPALHIDNQHICPLCKEVLTELDFDPQDIEKSNQKRRYVRAWIAYLSQWAAIGIFALLTENNSKVHICQNESPFSLSCPKMPEFIYLAGSIISLFSGIFDLVSGSSFGFPKLAISSNNIEQPVIFYAIVLVKILVPIAIISWLFTM